MRTPLDFTMRREDTLPSGGKFHDALPIAVWHNFYQVTRGLRPLGKSHGSTVVNDFDSYRVRVKPYKLQKLHT